MRGGLLLVPLVLAWLQAPGPGAAEETARVVEVRAGRHPTFDRMVVEIERDAPVFRLPRISGEMVLDLEARPLLPHLQVPTGFIRLQRVTLERLGDGMRIRVDWAGGPARAFVLRGPMRLVLDVADASVTEFEPPQGTERVPLLPLPAETPPSPPPSEPPPKTTPEAGESVVESVLPIEVPPVAPVDETGVHVSPVPPILAIPRIPTGVERPPPEPSLTRPAAPLTRPGGSTLPRWLALLAWVGGPVLLGGLGFYLTRQRRSETPGDLPRTPESITPEEVLNASDRLNLLEKRIDEEVRSRVQLEDRIVEVQEDLKVVRDRVNRITRRGETSP